MTYTFTLEIGPRLGALVVAVTFAWALRWWWWYADPRRPR
jgi:hypothetical protein